MGHVLPRGAGDWFLFFDFAKVYRTARQLAVGHAAAGPCWSSGTVAATPVNDSATLARPTQRRNDPAVQVPATRGDWADLWNPRGARRAHLPRKRSAARLRAARPSCRGVWRGLCQAPLPAPPWRISRDAVRLPADSPCARVVVGEARSRTDERRGVKWEAGERHGDTRRDLSAGSAVFCPPGPAGSGCSETALGRGLSLRLDSYGCHAFATQSRLVGIPRNRLHMWPPQYPFTQARYLAPACC